MKSSCFALDGSSQTAAIRANRFYSRLGRLPNFDDRQELADFLTTAFSGWVAPISTYYQDYPLEHRHFMAQVAKVGSDLFHSLL